MQNERPFDWKQFFRIAIAVIFLGAGIVLIGKSSGEFISLIIGVIFVGFGVALIMVS